MRALELTTEEHKLLQETLETRVSDLETEVAHTDSHDFRETLKHRKALLDQLLEKLRD